MRITVNIGVYISANSANITFIIFVEWPLVPGNFASKSCSGDSPWLPTQHSDAEVHRCPPVALPHRRLLKPQLQSWRFQYQSSKHSRWLVRNFQMINKCDGELWHLGDCNKKTEKFLKFIPLQMQECYIFSRNMHLHVPDQSRWHSHTCFMTASS